MRTVNEYPVLGENFHPNEWHNDNNFHCDCESHVKHHKEIHYEIGCDEWVDEFWLCEKCYEVWYDFDELRWYTHERKIRIRNGFKPVEVDLN